MNKEYKSSIQSKAAKPRSKRLREAGVGGSASSSITVTGAGAGGGTELDHTHNNLDTLDKLSRDSENYLRMQQVSEDADGGTVVSQERAKVGFADMSDDLLKDGKAVDWLKELFVRKDIPETLSHLLKLAKGAEFGEYYSINELGEAILKSLKLGNFGISELGAAIFSSLKLGQYGITEAGVATLSKVFANLLQSDGFKTGALGTGFTIKIDENGDSYIEVDRLFVRKIMEVVKLIIQELKHVGGQIILTPASMTCSRVEEFGSYYRCYFNQEDPSGKEINNQFEVGDQARRQTFNVKVGVNENFKNEYYWRLVVAVGEDYIDLSKTDCDAGSTVPQAGDEIVQLGNRNSLLRQGAIVLAAHGEGSPYIKIYKGINSYNLAGKEKVTLSPSIVDIIADNIRFSTGESVKDYIEGMMQDSWIDGKTYNAGTTLPFANCLVKAKNQTTLPPFKLLADDDGSYLVNAATGNYIVYCNAQGKPVLTQDWLIIQDNNDLINEVKTYTDSLFSITKEEIASKVSQETYAVDKDGMLTRLSSAESSITQHADEIASRVTKMEYATDKAGQENRLSTAESKITQQAELINLRVTKTEYETGLSDTERANKAYAEAQALLAEVQSKAYADGVVDEEEKRAIADATAKANAAKDAAIASAAQDATNKANGAVSTAKVYTDSQIKLTNDSIALKVSRTEYDSGIHNLELESKAYSEAQALLAKTTAEAYADGIVTEEEKRAIADATAKANAAKDAAIASAAQDATNKANGAVSSAKTYTDAQILLTDSKIDLKVSKTEMAAYPDWEDGRTYVYPNMVYFANVLFQAQSTTTLPPYKLLGDHNGNYLKNATTGDYIAVCNAQGKAVVNTGWKVIVDNNEIIQEGKTYTDAQILLTDNKISLKVSQSDYLVDKAGQELEAAKLRATGIDIELKKVTLTANTFLIQDNSGNPIAVFEIGSDGKPRLKADNVDADSIVVRRLRTEGNSRIIIENGLMQVFGSQSMNIRFGVDDTGMAVLQYYNNAGVKLYDLGPDGITKTPVVEEKWVPVRMILLGTTEAAAIANTSAYKYNAILSSTPTYYRYVSKVVAGVKEDPVNDGLLFTNASKNTKIPNGYYCEAVSYAKQDGSHHMLYHTGNTNKVITIDGMKSNQTLLDRDPLYYLYINYFVSGALNSYFMCGWNGGVGEV